METVKYIECGECYDTFPVHNYTQSLVVVHRLEYSNEWQMPVLTESEYYCIPCAKALKETSEKNYERNNHRGGPSEDGLPHA
jgi:hypothetical protein